MEREDTEEKKTVISTYPRKMELVNKNRIVILST